jgi:osmoprotectant transport system permease protein
MITLNFEQIMFKIGQQILMTTITIGISVVVAVPIGFFLVKHRRVNKLVMPIIITLQTIPSLALLALLVPFTGIGVKTAIIALVGYALLPILQNTVAGIKNVPDPLRNVARALGMTEYQWLVKIALPLSIPMLMRGVRLASVYVISWSTLAAYIGAGGLGDYIFAGLNLYEPKLILVGTVPLMILAVGVDAGLKRLTNWLIVSCHVDKVLAQ